MGSRENKDRKRGRKGKKKCGTTRKLTIEKPSACSVFIGNLVLQVEQTGTGLQKTEEKRRGGEKESASQRVPLRTGSRMPMERSDVLTAAR